MPRDWIDEPLKWHKKYSPLEQSISDGIRSIIKNVSEIKFLKQHPNLSHVWQQEFIGCGAQEIQRFLGITEKLILIEKQFNCKTLP